MKLKFELVDGYGVLVDDERDITKNGYHFFEGEVKKTDIETIEYINSSGDDSFKEVLFAEKELNLDVPIFEWRDFEVEKLANEKFDFSLNKVTFIKGVFIQGYKSNPARFTEEDLRKAIELALIDAEKSVLWSVNYHIHLSNKIIQSLQKYPQYVVMENELNLNGKNALERATFIPKLFTNSEGKQQGIIKEIIW